VRRDTIIKERSISISVKLYESKIIASASLFNVIMHYSLSKQPLRFGPKPDVH
jgi:hypothetical protein